MKRTIELYDSYPEALLIAPERTLFTLAFTVSMMAVASYQSILWIPVAAPIAEAFGIFGFLWLFGYGLLLFWYAGTNKLTITNKEFVMETGLVAINRRRINMRSVRAGDVKQTVLQRLLGAGDVSIWSAGNQAEFTIHGMPNVDKIHDILTEYTMD